MKNLGANNVDGAQPESALALGLAGNFYGTAWKGGPGGDGTVFNVTINSGLTTHRPPFTPIPSRANRALTGGAEKNGPPQ